MILVGDNYLPPIVGPCEGRNACPLVVRVDREPPVRILKILRGIFGKDAGQTQISANSLIFISVQGALQYMDAGAYLASTFRLMDELDRHLKQTFGVGAGKGGRWEIYPFLFPFEYSGDRFGEEASKVHLFFQTLRNRTRVLGEPYGVCLGVHEAFESAMETGRKDLCSPNELVGGAPVSRYGVQGDFFAITTERTPSFLGIEPVQGHDDLLVNVDSQRTPSQVPRIVEVKVQVNFWDNFFDIIKDKLIFRGIGQANANSDRPRRPSRNSIALGTLRSGGLTEEEREWASQEAGAYCRPTPATRFTPSVICVGNSQFKTLAFDLTTSLKGKVKSVRHVHPGSCPVTISNADLIAHRVNELQFAPEETLILISVISNSMVLNEGENKVNHDQTHLFSDAQPASFSRFEQFIDVDVAVVRKLTAMGYGCVVFGPFPRYFYSCCPRSDHMRADFDHLDLVTKIRDFNSYCGRVLTHEWPQEEEGRFLGHIHAERIFGANTWKSDLISSDRVHLSNKARMTLTEAVTQIVLEVSEGSDLAEWTEAIPIDNFPGGFESWCDEYRKIHATRIPPIVIPPLPRGPSTPTFSLPVKRKNPGSGWGFNKRGKK